MPPNGVAFASNKLELESLKLDPKLESTTSLELASQEELIVIERLIGSLNIYHSKALALV